MIIVYGYYQRTRLLGFYQGCFKIVQLGFNDFWDLVFKRYSNPFSLFDELIESNQFNDFIMTLNTKYIEDLEYELWLHKVYDKSFEEFKKDISISRDAQAGYMDEEDVKATVKKSNEILSNFTPQ